MSEQTLSYKDYTGSVEVSVEDNCLYGRILHIDDLVTYEGQTVEELQQAFGESVEEYLLTCDALGLEPNRPRQHENEVLAGREDA
jgi:predicted HicB family RNase H-like nuclease